MLISLYNKPDWYEELVPTKLVPALSIRGRIVWESADIMKASVQCSQISIGVPINDSSELTLLPAADKQVCMAATPCSCGMRLCHLQ